MRSRIGLLLLALAGLAMGVPMVMDMGAGGSAADVSADVARSALPMLGVWLLAGAAALAVGVVVMSLTRSASTAHQSPVDVPARASDPQSAGV